MFLLIFVHSKHLKTPRLRWERRRREVSLEYNFSCTVQDAQDIPFLDSEMEGTIPHHATCFPAGFPYSLFAFQDQRRVDPRFVEYTLPKTNIDPDNGPLEKWFSSTNQWFSGSMLVFQGVILSNSWVLRERCCPYDPLAHPRDREAERRNRTGSDTVRAIPDTVRDAAWIRRGRSQREAPTGGHLSAPDPGNGGALKHRGWSV